jgi:pimeloyl-ACP methyl ester carboxylesterase
VELAGNRQDRCVLTTLTDDGLDLALHDLGGVGPSMLCAHATGFHALVWQPFVDSLIRDIHGWAFDAAGHGASHTPNFDTFHWDRFGRDVLTIVDTLELDRPFAVGHSMGGAALVMAELMRPGTFRALYLFEPIIFPVAPVNEGASPMVQAAQRRRNVFASRDEAYDNYASKIPLNQLDPAALRSYVDHGLRDTSDGQVTLSCEREFEALIFSTGGNHRTFERLGELRCPTVIAMGEADGFGPATIAPLIAERIPGSELERFDGLGHFGPLQDPPCVAAAAAAFFARS